jgi:hypothetical protein
VNDIGDDAKEIEPSERAEEKQEIDTDCCKD